MMIALAIYKHYPDGAGAMLTDDKLITATTTRYHALISEFTELAGSLLLVNTSLNVRGEPTVCTPEDLG